MRARLYVKGVSETPVVSVESEKLTDGSEAWNLVILQEIVIPCTSEATADKAFDRIAEAVKKCTSEEVLTL